MNKKLSLFFLLLSVGLLTALVSGTAFAAGQPKGPPEHLKVQARPVFGLEGVVYTDALDNGFVEIGVVNEKLVEPVQRKLEALGLPVESFQVVVTEPALELEGGPTLQDRQDALMGGLEITFIDHPFAYSCTMGFNVLYKDSNDQDQQGFLTNSHCTGKEAEVDGMVHYQEDWAIDGDVIGHEVADPAGFTCGGGKKCRYADVALDNYGINFDSTPDRSFEFGKIAKTTGLGSLTIDGNFNITGEALGGDPTANPPTSSAGLEKPESLSKVGRTTGWSSGTVGATCRDVAAQGSKVLRLCQDYVNATVAGGDSGSPVFRDDGNGNVTLYGILWGGNSSGSYFIYSPIANIRADLASDYTALGDFTTHTGGGSTTPTPTPPTPTGSYDVGGLVLSVDQKGPWLNLTAEITVAPPDGGVNVKSTFSRSTDSTTFGFNGPTDGSGTVLFKLKTSVGGTYTVDVTSVDGAPPEHCKILTIIMKDGATESCSFSP